MLRKRLRRFHRNALFLLVLAGGLIVFGQQCAKVTLEHYEEVEFLSLGQNPFRLDPPYDYPQIRRLVFLIDMSQSMISGPCIQDVDANIGFSVSPVYQVYDPNKGTGNPHDHRATGIDCQVNRTLAIQRSSILNLQPNLTASPPIFFQTHLGMDHEGHRLGAVRQWIQNSLRDNPPLLTTQTKVMIVPVTGGDSQKKLEDLVEQKIGATSVYTFLNLSDPKLMQVLDLMESEQFKNLAASEGNEIWRYQNRTMGTSNIGGLLPGLYDGLQKDLREMNRKGSLTFTDYQVIPLGDGLISPITKHISDVLNFYAPCASCASDPKKCSSTCGTLVQKLNEAWGYSDDNTPEKIDFYMGLMQSLPEYFGAGDLRLDFVSLRRQRVHDAYPGKTTYFEDLVPLFQARDKKLRVWPLETPEPPFRLVGDTGKSSSFKVTHLFLLNQNARVDQNGNLRLDTDGDGLFDDEEVGTGTTASAPRTNGTCLDSFLASPAFAERCRAMKTSRSCDPTLDSDGDSLNECEEALLGTDPFDFDTDGDGIPDFLEWIYGLNPLYSDEKTDTNGDGYLNPIQFAAGLGPNVNLKAVRPDFLSRYEVNFQGKESIAHNLIGTVLVDLYEVIVHNVPVLQSPQHTTAGALTPLYVSRVGADTETQVNNAIPYDQQLLSLITARDYNTVTAIARILEVGQPEKAYWRLYKTSIPLSGVYKQPRLDLSQFRQLRARDRNEGK